MRNTPHSPLLFIPPSSPSPPIPHLAPPPHSSSNVAKGEEKGTREDEETG